MTETGYLPNRALSVPEFDDALRKGLGRAVLTLQRHDSKQYRDSVLYACLNDLYYDRQSEHSREEYLVDLIRASGEEPWYRKRLLDALRLPTEGQATWQVVEVLRSIAASGDREVREALYAVFDDRAAQGDYDQGWDIIELDGVPGFLHVIDAVSHQGFTDQNAWYFSSWIDDLREQSGQATLAALEEAAESRPFLRHQLDLYAAKEAERAEERQRISQPPPPIEYEAARDMLDEIVAANPQGHFTRLFGIGRRCTEEALGRLASDFCAESDPNRIRAFAALFHWRAFPLDPGPLIPLMRSDDRNVVQRIASVLGQVKNSAVRSLALELRHLKTGADLVGELLKANFEAGDEKLLQELSTELDDPVELHTLGMDMLAIFNTIEPADCLPALLELYERGPCSFCRRSVVDLLLKRDLLPDWIRDEARWDANPETRLLVA